MTEATAIEAAAPNTAALTETSTETTDAGAGLGASIETEPLSDEAKALGAKESAAKAAEEAKAKEEADAKAAKAARFEKAKKYSERLLKANAESKSLREFQMNAQRSIAHGEQLLRQERARAEQSAAELKAFRDDPLSHLEKLGIDGKTIGQKLVTDNSPEAKIERLQAQLEKQQADMQAREEAQQKAAQQAQERAVYQQAQQDFIKMAVSEEHPHLARFAKVDPYAILREGEAIFKDIADKNAVRARDGQAPLFYSDKDVLTYLNKKYSKLWENGDTPSSVSDAKGAKPVETSLQVGKEAQAGTRTATTTLTNRGSTQRTVVPPNLDDLEPAEAKRVMAAWLKQERAQRE